MASTAVVPQSPPTIGQIVRHNIVAIALFALGGLASTGCYLVGTGRILERIDGVERAQAATSTRVDLIDRDTRAAIGRTDRNTAMICQALELNCERPAPSP